MGHNSVRCPQVPHNELTLSAHILHTSKVHPFALYTFFPYLSRAQAKNNSHSQHSLYNAGSKKLAEVQLRAWGILRPNSSRLQTMNSPLNQQCAGSVGKVVEVVVEVVVVGLGV